MRRLFNLSGDANQKDVLGELQKFFGEGAVEGGFDPQFLQGLGAGKVEGEDYGEEGEYYQLYDNIEADEIDDEDEEDEDEDEEEEAEAEIEEEYYTEDAAIGKEELCEKMRPRFHQF